MASGARCNVIYKALGLYTYANQFDAPSGALQSATDVVIDRPGVVESRQDWSTTTGSTLATNAGGYARLMRPDPSSNNVGYVNETSCLTSFGYNTAGLVTGVSPTFGLYLSGSTEVLATSNTGTTSSINEVFTYFRANGNNYFLTGGKISTAPLWGSGPTYRQDDPGSGLGTCRSTGAGMPDALTPVDYSGTAGSGFTGLPSGSSTTLNGTSGGQRAYRIVYATKDRQNNLVRGAPSGRHIVYSTGPLTSWGLLIPLPLGQLYTGDIIQVYASEVAAATAGTEPSDVMFQVYEYILQAGDITKGYITFQDLYAAGYGPALYTNDTQDGILMAENRPPSAALGTYHKNVAWYGGVYSKFQALVLSILGVSNWVTTAGSETQFVLNGVTYKAAAAEDLPNHKFQLFTTGSASQNNANTARSLARAISWNNGSLFAAYVTPANSIQFQIVIKTLVPGDGTAYTMTSANLPSGSVTPALPATLKEDAKTSRLYFSKPSQPEAVPDNNYLSIGSPDMDITGLASLRDSLFVFKTDGLYRVTGTTAADIRIELFDATVKMQPGHFQSIARAGNQLFAFTNQGVVSVTESGVNILSQAIANLVEPYASQRVGLGDLVNNVSGHYLRVPFPSIGSASEAEKKYFLVLTDSIGKSSGGIGTQYVYVYNYMRDSWVSWTPPSVCMGPGVTTSANGGERVQFTSAVTNSIYNFATPTDGNYSAAANASFTYCVEDTENPLVLKRFYDIRVALTQSSGLTSISCLFSSDSGASPVTVTQAVGSGQYSVVLEVPREHAQCGQLNFTVTAPSGRMVVQAVSVSYDIISDRLPRARG